MPQGGQGLGTGSSRTRTVDQGSGLHPACASPTPPRTPRRPTSPVRPPQTWNWPAFPLVSLGVEPPAGIEPATPSLPWNHQEPLCEPPFPQVTPDRQGQSYRFSFSEVMRSLSAMLSQRCSCHRRKFSTPRGRTPPPASDDVLVRQGAPIAHPRGVVDPKDVLGPFTLVRISSRHTHDDATGLEVRCVFLEQFWP
jgi:hypothetical protein